MSAIRLPRMTSAVAKSTEPCNSGMSRDWMALTEMRPTPGMPKIASVMTAPDKRDPALMAKLDAVAGRILKK